MLLGEDHGEREIAQFADALFASLVPLGFHTIAVETGPAVTAKLRSWIASPDGRAAYAAFERKHGGTTAFYGWQNEWAFLEHAASSTGGRLQLWGLDQELMGSAGFLLEGMLAQHPGPQSTALIRQLLQEDAADYRKAAASGSPGDMFVLQVGPKRLEALQSSLAGDGNARAQWLARDLIATQDIYANCCNAMSARSNRDRAALMKQTLVAYLNATKAYATPPKIFFKFGVMALGVSGRQSRFAGIGQPWQAAPYTLADIGNGMFAFLSPFVENMVSDGWTLYDLRPLRSHFSQLGIADKEYERLVFGYDFLLLIPNTTADPAIAPDAF